MPYEVSIVRQKIHEEVKKAGHVTLCTDGWADNTNKSIWAFTANLPNGHCYLLTTFEASKDSHNGEWIRGMNLCMHLQFLHHDIQSFNKPMIAVGNCCCCCFAIRDVNLNVACCHRSICRGHEGV